MYELDQYKQKAGDLECFAGAPFKAIGSGSHEIPAKQTSK